MKQIYLCLQKKTQDPISEISSDPDPDPDPVVSKFSDPDPVVSKFSDPDPANTRSGPGRTRRALQ